MLKFILILALLSLTKAFLFSSPSNSTDPDENVSTFDLIKRRGYPAEQHDVLTKDGYIITMHRIAKPNSKKLILLQHGLMDSSSTWVINFANQSLGFILADNDYDVWLGNMRGNRYGLTHIKYNTSQDEFWDFSFDEMSEYDLTAMIDYVLDKTGQSNLFYVGHSQGTLIKFINSNPIYLNKIKLFIALGPVATVAHMNATIPNTLANLGSFSNQEIYFKIFGRHAFASTQFDFIIKTLCNRNGSKCGHSPNLNKTRMNVYFSHFPSGTSTKNMAHFAQLIASKQVQKYDYGKENNILHYNQTNTPIYDLKLMTTPTAIYVRFSERLSFEPEFLKNKNLRNL
jgi:lysosomal acid lipase/cholesteryl ester hydrolase